MAVESYTKDDFESRLVAAEQHRGWRTFCRWCGLDVGWTLSYPVYMAHKMHHLKHGTNCLLIRAAEKARNA